MRRSPTAPFSSPVQAESCTDGPAATGHSLGSARQVCWTPLTTDPAAQSPTARPRPACVVPTSDPSNRHQRSAGNMVPPLYFSQEKVPMRLTVFGRGEGGGVTKKQVVFSGFGVENWDDGKRWIANLRSCHQLNHLFFKLASPWIHLCLLSQMGSNISRSAGFHACPSSSLSFASSARMGSN